MQVKKYKNMVKFWHNKANALHTKFWIQTKHWILIDSLHVHCDIRGLHNSFMCLFLMLWLVSVVVFQLLLLSPTYINCNLTPSCLVINSYSIIKSKVIKWRLIYLSSGIGKEILKSNNNNKKAKRNWVLENLKKSEQNQFQDRIYGWRLSSWEQNWSGKNKLRMKNNQEPGSDVRKI